MNILTIVGGSRSFSVPLRQEALGIKAAPVSKALRQAGHTEYLLHTGQHYDYGMPQVFFD